MRFSLLICALCASVASHAQIITTVAGGGQPRSTEGSLGAIARVAVDATGNVFASDVTRHIIWKIAPGGEIAIFAGNGISGYSGDFGPATQAQLNAPTGLAVDASGNVFVADSSNHRVRKIGLDGSISTVAGNGEGKFSGDSGLATQAALQIPHGVAFDSLGNLYIADMYNHRVRKVNTEGRISTLAGIGRPAFGGDGGPAEEAALAHPSGIAIDKKGNIYIADTDNQRIRRIGSEGRIVTVAGLPVPSRGRTASPGYGGDDGPAVLARLNQPVSVAVDADGNLYIADTGNHSIRKVNAQGIITTVTGNGRGCLSGDGRAATTASLNQPAGVALDAQGNLYIADTGNMRVRKITAAGTIVTLAGDGGLASTGDGGKATSATLRRPLGVAVDQSTGDLYISDSENNRVRKVDADGVIRAVAGNGASCFIWDDAPAIDTPITVPRGLAVDSSGTLYIADHTNRVRRLDSQGTLAFVLPRAFGDPSAIAVDNDNRVFIAEGSEHWVRQVSVGGSSAIVARGFRYPAGLAWDPDKGLYIADLHNHVVQLLDASGSLRTVVGAEVSGEPNSPIGLAVDGAGNLYIADAERHRVRRVSPGGKIETVAGRGAAGFSGDDGPAAKAALNRPYALAVDTFGNLYVADSMNDRIRKITMPPSLSAMPAALDLSGVTSRTIRLRASNPALTWEATPSVPWLKLSSLQGAFPATVTVSADGSLPAGEHGATIEFRSPGAPDLAVSVAIVLRKE